MCFIWEGRIERCQNCSNTDFSNLLKIVYNVEPGLPIDQRVARRGQRSLDQGHPHSSSGDVDKDLHRGSTVENIFDREQDLRHQNQSSSSRNDTPINGTAQHKRRRTDADHTSTEEASQQKRQRLDPVQHPTLRHEGRIEEQRQRGRQGPTPGESSSWRQDTHSHGACQFGRPVQSSALAFSVRDARSDGQTRSEHKRTQQDAPYSSRHRTISNLIDEEEYQATSSRDSPSPSGIEDVPVLTAGMNLLPPPCWKDERAMLRLAQQQLMEERYYAHQQRRMYVNWAPYERERAALAAVDNTEPEKIWEPDFEEVEILKTEIPLEDEIWASSVLAGEDWMREILDEDDSWPPQPVAEPNIWTREEGGMLHSSNLKKLLQIFTLQAALEEEED